MAYKLKKTITSALYDLSDITDNYCKITASIMASGLEVI